MASSAEVSVVIPVYNDPEGIRATLKSLTAQRDAPEYEVLAVDNDSTDTTRRVISEFETQYPEIVTGLSKTDVQSSYAARNTGIKYASGEIIAFIDADMTVGETWAADLREAFHESDVDYLGYNVKMYVPEGEDTFWARYDVAMGLPVEHYLKTKEFAPTCALAVRQEIIEEVGLFDEDLVSGGDKEFGKRVHNRELTPIFEQDIVSYHPARTSLSSHIKKAARIGRGQSMLWRKHDLAPHPLSPVRLLPPNPLRIKRRNRKSTFNISFFLASFIFKILQNIYSIVHYSRYKYPIRIFE